MMNASDILHEVETHGAILHALNLITAKIVTLHSTSLQASFLGTTEADHLAGEQPTF